MTVFRYSQEISSVPHSLPPTFNFDKTSFNCKIKNKYCIIYLFYYLTSSSFSFWSLSFSSISLSSPCKVSKEVLSGPHSLENSTIAMVYWTRVAQSSLEYLAAAIVIPLVLSGDGDLFLAVKCTSKIKVSCTGITQNSRADRHGHDRMVVGFTTTCAISAYHH